MSATTHAAAAKLAALLNELENDGFEVWAEGSSLMVNGVEIAAPNLPCGGEWTTKTDPEADR